MKVIKDKVRNKYNNVHIIKCGRGNQIYFKEVLNNYFINKIKYISSLLIIIVVIRSH